MTKILLMVSILVTASVSFAQDNQVSTEDTNGACFAYWEQDGSRLDDKVFNSAVSQGISAENARTIATIQLGYLDSSTQCVNFRNNLQIVAIEFLKSQKPEDDCRVSSMGVLIIDCKYKEFVDNGTGGTAHEALSRELR